MTTATKQKRTSSSAKARALAEAVPTVAKPNPFAEIDLSTRSCIVALHVSRWKGVKTDKAVTDEIHKQKNASDDAGTYRKQLVSKDLLKNVNTEISRTRDEHELLTLPWSDDGYRVLLGSGYFNYVERMEKRKAAVMTAAEKVFESFETQLAAEEKRLGSMFKLSDYPSLAELRRKYSVSFVVLPMPKRDDFRLNLSKEEIRRLQENFDEIRTADIRSAMLDVASRIREVVENVAEQLRGYAVDEKTGKVTAGRLYESTLDSNVKKLVGLLPSLNLTADPRIDEIADRMSQLTRYSTEQLKGDASLRTKIAADADQILRKMGDFI